MQLFKAALSLALLASSALAQGTQITYPPSGSTVTAGSNITVQFRVDNFVENVDVVSVVLGIAPCNGNPCPSATDQSFLGNILYQGPYVAQPPFYKYENYTVTIPEGLTLGNASLTSICFALIADALEPTLWYANQNVTVVA